MELAEFLKSKAVVNENAPAILAEGNCVISKLSDLKESKYGPGYSLSINNEPTIFLKSKFVIGTPCNGAASFTIKQGTNAPFMELQFENRNDTLMNQAASRGFALKM